MPALIFVFFTFLPLLLLLLFYFETCSIIIIIINTIVVLFHFKLCFNCFNVQILF